MSNWLYSHQLAIEQAQTSLKKTWVSTCLICMLIGCSLSVPGLLGMLILTADELSAEFKKGYTMTLFFDLPEENAQSLASTLRTKPAIKSVLYMSPAQALAKFEQSIGLGAAGFNALTSPLPPTAILTLTDNTDIALLTEELVAIDGVNEVIFDQKWTTRAAAILTTADRLLGALSALLIAGIVLIISNTLKVLLQSRADEFRLLTLVGATKSYMARPFLYTGLGYGIGGALVATIIIASTALWLLEPLHQLYNSYNINLALEVMAPKVILVVWLASVGFSWVGARIGVWLFLQRYVPY